MKKQHYLIILLAFIIAYLAIYFIFFKKRHEAAPISVAVATVIQKNVEVTYQTIGTVQAYSSVEMKSMVTGPLIQIGFKEGDIVNQGQVLFVIDPRSYRAVLDQAKATLARDVATMNNDQEIVKRNTPLVQKGFLDKQNFDTLNATAKSMAATVAADQAAVETAQVNLDFTQIRAPISGKTGNIALKLGSIIKANDTLALVSINQINPIYVVFSVPQNKLTHIQQQQKIAPLSITAIINNSVTEKGTLTFIDNTVDAATGTIQLKATFDNVDHLLWPGQYVTAIIPLEKIENAITVPSLAVQTAQKGFYVYVIDADSIAHLRYVTIGSVVNEETVIEKGLQPGEKVVTSGTLRLIEGAPVNVIPDAAHAK